MLRGDPAAEPGGRSRGGRCAGSTAPGRRRTAPAVPATARSPTWSPRLDRRDVRGRQARDRQLALGGRAVLPAHRQAPAARSTPRSPSSSSASRSARFRQTPVDHLSPNRLVLRLQPDEGISLRFRPRCPGPSVRIGTVNMDFCYDDYFGSQPSHRLRDAALRRDERRRDPLPARGLRGDAGGAW